MESPLLMVDPFLQSLCTSLGLLQNIKAAIPAVYVCTSTKQHVASTNMCLLLIYSQPWRVCQIVLKTSFKTDSLINVNA